MKKLIMVAVTLLLGLGLMLSTLPAYADDLNLSPDGDATIHLDDVGTPGDANYVEVNDPVGAPDGNSTYVYVSGTFYNLVDTESSDPGDQFYPNTPAGSNCDGTYDLYTLSDPASALDADINSVTINAVVMSNASPLNQFQPDDAAPIIGASGWYVGTVQSLTNSYSTISSSYTVNPNTGLPWTWAEMNALGAGVVMSEGGVMSEARCTQVYAVVNYTMRHGPAVAVAPTSIGFEWFNRLYCIPIDELVRTHEGFTLEGANPGDPQLVIGPGTQVLGGNGLLPPYIEGVPGGTPPPPVGTTMIAAYQFNPSGITFSPAAQIVMNYDPEDVPAGSVLVIAYYEEAVGQWMELETAGYVLGGEEVPNAVTCDVAHFTYFALLAK